MAYGKRYKSARNSSNIRLHFHFSAIHKRFPLLGVSVLKNHRTFARRQKRFAVVYIFRIQFNIYVYCECKPQPFSPVREEREGERKRQGHSLCSFSFFPFFLHFVISVLLFDSFAFYWPKSHSITLSHVGAGAAGVSVSFSIYIFLALFSHFCSFN